MVVAVVSEPAMKISFRFRKIDSFESGRSSSGALKEEKKRVEMVSKIISVEPPPKRDLPF